MVAVKEAFGITNMKLFSIFKKTSKTTDTLLFFAVLGIEWRRILCKRPVRWFLSKSIDQRSTNDRHGLQKGFAQFNRHIAKVIQMYAKLAKFT